MSFKDRDWEHRFGKMGDEAEGVFEQTAPLGFVRYGLNRPPIQMHKLPARLRYTPDYLMSSRFVEVQGFGKDQMLKLKLSKWGALRWWNDVHPVELFVWDSTNKRYCYVTLDQLEALDATLDRFPEGHAYFQWPAEDVFRVGEGRDFDPQERN